MRSIVRAVCELDYPVRGAVLAPPARGHVSAPVHGDLADRPVHAQRALQGLVDQIPASQVPSDQVGCRVREMTGQPVHVHAAGGAHEDAGPDQPVQRIVERSLASPWNSLRRSRLRYTYLPVTSHRFSTLIASLCLMPHKCTRTVQNTLFTYTYGVGVEFAGLGARLSNTDTQLSCLPIRRVWHDLTAEYGFPLYSCPDAGVCAALSTVSVLFRVPASSKTCSDFSRFFSCFSISFSHTSIR